MRNALLALVVLTGCSPAHRVSGPIVAVAPPAPFAIDPPARPATPLSISRLLGESQREMSDMGTLTKPLSDPRGQARAMAEVNALADELRDVETALRESQADSGRLDAIATQLQLLQTRIAIVHDRLRVASLPSTAVESD